MTRHTYVILIILITINCCLLSGCKSQRSASTPPTPAATPANESAFAQLPSSLPSPPPVPAKPHPPTAEEVNQAVARVFQNVATPETSSPSTFVIGDFNGDGAEDLAVVIKPRAGMLAELNNELANWTLEDPRRIPADVSRRSIQNAPAQVQVVKRDKLLAVIHGVGPYGWRNEEARQTFVLQNTVGSKMTVASMDKLKAKNFHGIRGDGIHATCGNDRGLLLWNGAKYAWYSGVTEK